MSRPLTAELVRARSKADNLMYVRKFTLCGNDIDDIKVVRQLPNIEVLSLSVNRINSLRDFAYCPRLQELYVRKNNISDLSQIKYLSDLPDLKILWLCENPCADTQHYREKVISMLPNLQSLDNVRVTPEEKEAAERMNFNIPEPRSTSKQSESPTKRATFQDQRQSYEQRQSYPESRQGYPEQRQNYQDQRIAGNRNNFDRDAPANVADYNEYSYPTQEETNDYPQYEPEEVRRPSYGVRVILKVV